MTEIKHALRQLKLRPGLSAVVILMLALGLGATTAMFSLYEQILVRPLSVPEPERLVNLSAPGGDAKPGGRYRDLAIADFEAQFTYPMFRDLEKGQRVFTGIAGHTDFVANLSFHERPAYGRGALVSGSYFGVLNLRPVLGRLIGLDDEPRIGESAVAVLSYDYWQRQFGGDPKVVGQTLTVNGQQLEIIGVGPVGFTGTVLGTRMDVFVPLTMRWLMVPTLGRPDVENRQSYWLYLFARLAPGVTLEKASAQLNGLYSGILNEVEAPALSAQQFRGGTLEGALDRFRERQVTFSPGARGQSQIPATAARPLELLLGVTVLVLLIVCVNVANLLLARGAARAGEMAIRSSIGASRGRLVRQLLAESFVLIAIGGLSSLLIAAFIVRLFAGMLPNNVVLNLALSPTAMAFAAAASFVTVLVFGLAPAWRASDARPAQAMNASRSSGGRSAVRFRGVLTTAQIAFSMVLLVLAGLFTRSLMNVGRQDLGMDVDSIVSFSITPHLNLYSPARLAALYDRIEETFAAQPGVRGVGTTAIPLFYDFSLGGSFSVEGVDSPPGVDAGAAWSAVGSGYFDTLGVPLRSGRALADRDTADVPPVAVVNESFARKFRLDSPVGKHLGFGRTTSYPIEIVGVVADAKHASVKGDAPPVIYFARRQMAEVFQSLWVYVRAGLDPDALRSMIPRVVAEIDPNVPIVVIETMRDRVHANVYIDRLLSMLSAAFAALATLLAGVGLYGVLAYNVAQRTRELGLRLALGADPKRLRRMILQQVGVMAMIGAAVGLASALAIGRIAEAVLFGLSGHDPLVIGTAVVVLAAVVLVASWLPAWRASRIAPLEALRYE